MANDREGRPVKPPGKKPGARLASEEHELWELTARSIQPIKGKKGRVHAALEDADEAPPRPGKNEPPKPSATKHKPVAPPPPSRVAPPPPVPAPISLERRKARKLSSGRIEI